MNRVSTGKYSDEKEHFCNQIFIISKCKTGINIHLHKNLILNVKHNSDLFVEIYIYKLQNDFPMKF